MDALLILLVVGGPLLIIAALVWSASLRGPAMRPSPRKGSGEIPAVLPDEYAYERRMEERRASDPAHERPEDHE
jgi:hypothetical protein